MKPETLGNLRESNILNNPKTNKNKHKHKHKTALCHMCF